MTTEYAWRLSSLAAKGAHDLSRQAQDALLASMPEGDPDRFRSQLNESYYPARVEIEPHDRWWMDARIRTVRLTHLTLGFVRFGAAAIVDPGMLRGYHVNVPLAGRVLSRYGEQESVAVPGRAMVFGPGGHVTLPEWGSHSAQLCVKIDRGVVERELEALLGRTLGGHIQFQLDADLETPSGARWLAATELLLDMATADQSATASAHLERHWIDQLLLMQQHQYADELSDERRLLTPRPVKRVVDLIESSADLAFTLADLAAHAGVSARALQQGFMAHRGTTPMSFLRTVRLDRVHDDLVRGELTVGETMARWGFHNAGRFSAMYQARYGETAGTTLRRVRGE